MKCLVQANLLKICDMMPVNVLEGRSSTSVIVANAAIARPLKTVVVANV